MDYKLPTDVQIEMGSVIMVISANSMDLGYILKK